MSLRNGLRLNMFSRHRNVASVASNKVMPKLDMKTLDEFTKSECEFKNVKTVGPDELSKHFYTRFKLKFVERNNKKLGAQLLRNITANYDYWIVRSRQCDLLYYRNELLIQRLKFLSSVGLNHQQKFRHVQKHPPVLLFSFTDPTYNAKLVYLRGLVHDKANYFLHLFHPVTSDLAISRSDIQQRVETVQHHLKIQQPAAIRELLNIPCFFCPAEALQSIDTMVLHKHTMPFPYSMDSHSLHLLPPVLNLPALNLTAKMHFSNAANDPVVSDVPVYAIPDLLDYSYPNDNGLGTAECLSSFLRKAELEEKKDRTAGQPVKGYRGFNVPARQY